MRVAPFEVAQSCLTQNTICSGMLADKKNAGPVAFYPTVGVWRGRDRKICKPHSGKTKNASESRSAAKHPAIPLVSMVTSKKPAFTTFCWSKMPKTDIRCLFGPYPRPKINSKGIFCLDIPIYTHKYPYITIYTHIWDHLRPFGTIWDLFGPFETIWDHLGPFGTIWDHLGPFGTIWDHLGPFGTIWDHI